MKSQQICNRVFVVAVAALLAIAVCRRMPWCCLVECFASLLKNHRKESIMGFITTDCVACAALRWPAQMGLQPQLGLRPQQPLRAGAGDRAGVLVAGYIPRGF